MVGHPSKSCYIFKDILQALIDGDVLKLRLEQKKVTADMMSLQFGRNFPSVPAEVVLISKGELKVINTDPYHKKEKGFVLVLAPRENIMWVYPDIIKTSNGLVSPTKHPKAKQRHPLITWCALSQEKPR